LESELLLDDEFDEELSEEFEFESELLLEDEFEDELSEEFEFESELLLDDEFEDELSEEFEFELELEFDEEFELSFDDELLEEFALEFESELELEFEFEFEFLSDFPPLALSPAAREVALNWVISNVGLPNSLSAQFVFLSLSSANAGCAPAAVKIAIERIRVIFFMHVLLGWRPLACGQPIERACARFIPATSERFSQWSARSHHAQGVGASLRIKPFALRSSHKAGGISAPRIARLLATCSIV
jgi:hypothetical protein